MLIKQCISSTVRILVYFSASQEINSVSHMLLLKANVVDLVPELGVTLVFCNTALEFCVADNELLILCHK